VNLIKVNYNIPIKHWDSKNYLFKNNLITANHSLQPSTELMLCRGITSIHPPEAFIHNIIKTMGA